MGAGTGAKVKTLLAILAAALLFGALPALAQTQSLLPNAMTQFVDGNGAPYAGGSVYFYVPSTTTPKNTYQDPLGRTPNANPVELDANGRALIWGQGEYREVLKDSLGNTIWDQLTLGLGVPGAADTLQCSTSSTGGSANAQVLNPSVAVSSLTIGNVYCAVAGSTNTGSMTLKVGLVGFEPVEKPTSSGLTPLVGGEVQVGQMYLWAWDGTEFQLINSSSQLTLDAGGFIPPSVNPATTDVSAYLQIAANDGCALNGALIRLRAGTYLAHDILNSCGNFWQGDTPGGVGSSNQTVVGSIVPGGTTVKYGGESNSAFTWEVPGFPNFASNAHINGGGIDGFTFINQSASTGWVLISEGTQDWKASNLVANSAYNGIYMKGDEFPVTSHISMYGTKSLNYQIVGDLTGQTISGAGCSTSNADCSTRNDGWFGEYLTNIDNTGTNTVVTITGFVATPVLSHVLGEGPAQGLVATCPSGLASNLSQCPQFGRFDDVQIENFEGGAGVVLGDVLNYQFKRLYSVGSGNSNGSYAFYASTPNYSSASPPPGRIQVLDSELFASWDDCFYVGGALWDVRLVGTEVNACNLSNLGYNFVNVQTTGEHVLIANNTIGTVDGYNGSPASTTGIKLGTGSSWVDVHDNTFDGLTVSQAPVQSSSSLPGTVHVHDNLGPGSVAPTLSSCGTSPAFTNVAHDDEFVVTVGTGSPTGCTATFATPYWSAPACVVSPASGASSTGLAIANSATSVTISGSGLSGSYLVICRAP